MATAQLGTLLQYVHKLAAGCGSLQRTDRQLLDDFSARRDEAAFAALVARHGPMVLRVCRRVLNHEQDAEDAFQATFLILARKTGSIRKALAEWLHGVAYRTALEVKRGAARRRNHEARLWTVMRKAAVSPTWDDVQAVLDEEIQRLPEPFRAAFVLCVLEGKSRPEAAVQLGVKEGTASSRLARARRLLQRRLGRRGIQLTALLAAVSVAEGAGKAAVPAALAQTTLRFGLWVAAGGTVAEQIPSPVAALAAGVTRAMFLTKAKIALVSLFVVGLIATGAGVLTHQTLAAKETPPVAQKAESPAKGETKPQTARTADGAKDEKGDSIAFSGQVVDPDGKPVKNAKVYIATDFRKDSPLSLRASTGDDGRYRFSVRKAEFDTSYSPEPWKEVYVFARAEGYGLGLSQHSRDKPFQGGDMTIKLAKDDVPIAGRILDLQGKPLAGIKIRVRGVRWPIKGLRLTGDRWWSTGDTGDLTDFIKDLKARKDWLYAHNELMDGLKSFSGGWDLDNVYPPVRTDTAGRFRINGIGRERVADLLIEGPAIETNYVFAMTRACETIEVPAQDPKFTPGFSVPVRTQYGIGFDHVATPSQPIVGVVRDKDTGKPIPGAVVRSKALASGVFDLKTTLFRAVTDKDGRYRITGMPRGKGNQLQASPPADLPYLMALKEAGDMPGLEPITLDFALKRGVWIDVKVTNKVTSKPVACRLDYAAFLDNPHLKEVPDFADEPPGQRVAEDGKFRLVGLPGRGLIGVNALKGRYLSGVGADKIEGVADGGLGPSFSTSPRIFSANDFHALVDVNPDKADKSVKVEMTLDPGRTVTCTILGPDGKPLTGVMVGSHTLLAGRFYAPLAEWTPEPATTSAFTATSLDPDKPRLLLFVHLKKRLAGSLVVRGYEKGPLTVKLGPAGTLTGRLVTPDGEPMTKVDILSFGLPQDLAYGSFPGSIKPDQDGKFRIEGLVPGLKYNLMVMKAPTYNLKVIGNKPEDLTIKPGETKDLGDIQVKPME